MSDTPKTGGELFIVDNSESDWKGLRYLQDWTQIASGFDIATGCFEIGSLLVLDHATSEIAIGTELGIDATRKLSGEGFKRPWPPLIRMVEEVRRKMDALFGNKP